MRRLFDDMLFIIVVSSSDSNQPSIVLRYQFQGLGDVRARYVRSASFALRMHDYTATTTVRRIAVIHVQLEAGTE